MTQLIILSLCGLLAGCGWQQLKLSPPTAVSLMEVQQVPVVAACDIVVDLSRWRAARRTLMMAARSPLEAQTTAMRAAIADAISTIDTVLVPVSGGCGVRIK
jgi:hypothetical protein